jgi:uncharacterized protein
LGNYTLVTTCESDDKGMPKNYGQINGGFYPKKDDNDKDHPSVVLAVDDIQAAMKKIKEAGGTVIGEPVEIPGYGTYVSFTDTEGNTNSVIQPAMDEHGNKK